MRSFPTTHWSVVLRAGGGHSEKSGVALEALCRTYWQPIYTLARSLGETHQDAQDLVQGFFAHLIESNLPGKAHPQAGRFRSFLLVSFRNFRSARLRSARTFKRGGDITLLSLDRIAHSEQWPDVAKEALTPELCFDKSWALAVFNRAHELLANEYAEAGQQKLFARLSGFLPARDDGVAYERLATEFYKSVAAIKMDVSRMRKRYLRLLQTVVGETVSIPADVADELRYLLQLTIE